MDIIYGSPQCKSWNVPYHDEPPDGEAEGEPDADGVDHDAEVGVEPDDGRPERRR